jgi:hypothetical protein
MLIAIFGIVGIARRIDSLDGGARWCGCGVSPLRGWRIFDGGW